MESVYAALCGAKIEDLRRDPTRDPTRDSARDLGGELRSPASAEPKNGLMHVTAIGLAKIADGLIDPKLVLAWMLASIGAPAAALQGLCVFAIALVAFTLSGATAGWSKVALLALLALARSICSISHKDALAHPARQRDEGRRFQPPLAQKTVSLQFNQRL